MSAGMIYYLKNYMASFCLKISSLIILLINWDT